MNPSTTSAPAKRRRLNAHEANILEAVSNLRVSLACYQQYGTGTKDLDRANWFAETHLDPLISDIADLKEGQPLRD